MNNHIYLQLTSLNKNHNNHFLKRYVKLVSFYKERNCSKQSGLYEHHIIPESFGGLDTKENLVFITIREHFILHWMLYKAFPKSTMVNAFHMMRNCSGQKVSSKVYEKLMLEFIERQSETQNRMVVDGTHPWLSGDIQRKMNKKQLENGTHISKIKIECEHCKKIVDKFNFTQNHGDNCKLNPLFKDKPKVLCEHCNRLIDIANFSRYYGDKCKQNPLFIDESIPKPKIECEHCKREFYKANYNQFHGDNCKLNPLSKSKLKIICEHCKREFSSNTFAQWHGDNCKLKPE